jgi:peptidoglycan glycosyltransferase
MNKTIRRTSVFSLLLVLSLLLRATWLQAVQAEELQEDPHNRRNLITRYAQPLGDIIVAGEPVTGSEKNGDGGLEYRRTYTDGELYAPVTGHRSPLYRSTLLEGVYKDVLDGTDPLLKDPVALLSSGPAEPGDVLTTIDPAVQRAGFEALSGMQGAAVAVDPETGEILAVVSTPSYDPEALTGLGPHTSEARQRLSEDEDEPLLNRALRATYPPGSTFKLVVAAAALEEGLYDDVDEPTDSPDPYTLENTSTVLTNEIEGAPCEDASIRTALRYSCNTVFAKMAADLGEEAVREMAEEFGFNDDGLNVPVSVRESVYPSDMAPSQTGLTGIGQYDVTATPLQMAMVSQAIANGGVLTSPHMVSEVRAADGDVLENHQDPDSERVLDEDTAGQLADAMRTVVEEGTGSNAHIPGLTVGGKTGTAQHGVDNSERPYAWFTSYAEGPDGEQVAVAVVVEDADVPRSEISGNGLAAPVARAMMSAALQG